MRKAGILDDAEQITNPNFRAHQPASRALVSQMAIKSIATDNRQLKYNDRVPMRKSIGGLAEENLKDPQARDMARAQLVTSDMGARVVQEMSIAIDYQAQYGSLNTLPPSKMAGEQKPFAAMAAGSEAPQRDRRRDGQALGSGPEHGPAAFVYDPAAAAAPPAAMEVEFVAAAGGKAKIGPLTNALANGAMGRAESGKALGANRGQGGGRGPTNRSKLTRFDKAAKKAAEESGIMDTAGAGNTTTKTKAEGGDAGGKKAKIQPAGDSGLGPMGRLGWGKAPNLESGPSDAFGRLMAIKAERRVKEENRAAKKEAIKKAKEEKEGGRKAKEEGIEADKREEEEAAGAAEPQTQVAPQVQPFRFKPVTTIADENVPVPEADDGLEVTKTLDPYQRLQARQDDAWASGRGVNLTDKKDKRLYTASGIKKPRPQIKSVRGKLGGEDAIEDALEDYRLVLAAQTAEAVATLHMATVKQSAADAGPLPGATDNNPVVAAGIASAPGNQAVGATLGGNARAPAGLLTHTTTVDNMVTEGIMTAYQADAAAQFQAAQVKTDDPETQGTMQRGNIVHQQGVPADYRDEAAALSKVKQEIRDGSTLRKAAKSRAHISGQKRKEAEAVENPKSWGSIFLLKETPGKKQDRTGPHGYVQYMQRVNATKGVNPFAMAKRENAVGVTELPYAQMAIITGQKPELLKRLESGNAGTIGPAAHNFLAIMHDSLAKVQVNISTPVGAFTPQLMDRLNEVWLKYSGDETKKIGTNLVQHEGGRRDLVGRMLYMSLIDAVRFEESDKAQPGQADVDYVDIFAQAYLTQMGTVSADAQQQAAFNLAKMGVVKDTRTLQAIANTSVNLRDAPVEVQREWAQKMIWAAAEHMTRADTGEAGLIPENPAVARARMALRLQTGEGFQEGLQAGANNIPLDNSAGVPWQDVPAGALEDNAVEKLVFSDEEDELDREIAAAASASERRLVTTRL